MPPAPRKKKTTRPAGTFARLRQQAQSELPPIEPYVMDDVDPPVVIQCPTTVEQQVGLHGLMDEAGDFETKDARRVLELICGDAFEQVWELVRREHITILIVFIRELFNHFAEALELGARDFPGGSQASSN